jgi:hypothetical protein
MTKQTEREKVKTETKTNAFVIFERATNRTLATLPLTAPIQPTLDAYARAGLVVSWKWGELKK